MKRIEQVRYLKAYANKEINSPEYINILLEVLNAYEKNLISVRTFYNRQSQEYKDKRKAQIKLNREKNKSRV